MLPPYSHDRNSIYHYKCLINSLSFLRRACYLSTTDTVLRVHLLCLSSGKSRSCWRPLWLLLWSFKRNFKWLFTLVFNQRYLPWQPPNYMRCLSGAWHAEFLHTSQPADRCIALDLSFNGKSIIIFCHFLKNKLSVKRNRMQAID